MDPRKPTQGDEDERDAENVVRLPRDWLGSRDELVPIGSRAHADDVPTNATPPTAASFWDEDSGSLQAPMQAPAGAWQPTPAARQAPPRLRRRRLSRPRFGWSAGRAFISGRRATAALGVLAAGLLMVLAVIGRSEGGTHYAGHKTASVSKNTSIETGAGVNSARLKPNTRVVTNPRTQGQSHRAGATRNHANRSRTHKHRIHVTTIRRRRRARPTPKPTHATSEPVRTTAPANTQTTVSPATTNPSGTASAHSAPPSSSDSSSSSSSQQQPAFGPNGSLGPGNSPDS